MTRKFTAVTTALFLVPLLVLGQGLTTSAAKTDWEEINFEFNSHILSDGYPSMLRLAELLNKHPDYKVKVAGHTDWVGGHPYNDKLAQRRADAVKAFLVKYGARDGQVTIGGSGKRDPKVDNKTKEGRFMNRRVVMTVTDANGRIIGDGGMNDIIPLLEKLLKAQEECCSNILRRLDRLDEIMRELDALRKELANLRRETPQLAQTPAPAPAAAPQAAPGLTKAEAEEIVEKAAAKFAQPRFALMGLNAGADDQGRVTFSGSGRYFAPFREHLAVQLQGEYLYFRDRQEGQLDAGLVTRWNKIQLGGFSSFKNVSFRDYQSTGTLGQAAFTFDYLFKGGRLGAFGTKSFMNNAVIHRVQQRHRLTETYMNVVDQLGGSGAYQFHKNFWLEGNLGYLKTKSDNDKPGGTLRLVFPLSSRLAFTVEGGVNETLIGSGTNGRAVAGILFGNFTPPSDFVTVSHPVPVQVPRLRYELLTRTSRTGNDPPVADAGPDQLGIQPGTITLDGSASYDPDGDPITFAWTQIAGPGVALTGANTAKATFNAELGQSYAFRLVVKDDQGAQSMARVAVSAREALRARIVRFTANPPLVRPGEMAMLNYVVENATSVTISGVSMPLNPATGSVHVNPTATTNYTLVARNASSQDTAVVTVLVERVLPRIITFAASPAAINRGDSSTLTWLTQDADSVEIVGVGTFGPSGETKVSPTETTTYTLVARNPQGEAKATAAVVVDGTGGGGVGIGVPIIRSFSANPMEIPEGSSTNLSWNVEGADEVIISGGVGAVTAAGTRSVTPPQSTTYVLTARNRRGEVTATAGVIVNPAVRILTFNISPTTIYKPFVPITVTWQTENAVEVFISGGIGSRPFNGTFTTAGPGKTTTYTLTAIGKGSQATAQVTVTIDPNAPDGTVQPPQAVIQPNEIQTESREVQLNASRSFDPQGLPLTFQWRSMDGRGEVVDPTSPTPTARLTSTQFNDFIFGVTVTNSKGASNSGYVRVLLKQRVP